MLHGFHSLTRTIALLLTLTCICGNALAASEEAMWAQLENLNWQHAGTYTSASRANLTIDEDQAALFGKDAETFVEVTEGHNLYKPDSITLKLLGDEVIGTVWFSHNDVGHITMDDWEELMDADQVLDAVSKATEERNKVVKEGYDKLYTVGWALKPSIDRSSATVFWALNIRTSAGQNLVNAKALKLNRDGYTEIIWIGSPEQFAGYSSTLEPAINNYNFTDGYRYADYDPSVDGAAVAGVGALAFAMLTGKEAAKKFGWLAAIAIFFKKFWVVLFFPAAWAWRKFKKKPTPVQANESEKTNNE